MDELLSIVQKVVDEKGGERALLYDFHKLNPFIGYIVICNAPGVRQTHTITDNIKDHVHENGYEIRMMGGGSESRWVLADLSSVVVHVFMNEERGHFRLEKLYADLPHEDFSL